MPPERILALIDAAAETIAANADELTRLDQAIGDGDHGSNMVRGFQAIAAQREALAEQEPGDALQKAGMILVTTVGGASGPLYGSLLMGIGKGLKAGKDHVEAIAEGVDTRQEARQVRRRRQDDARCPGADAGGPARRARHLPNCARSPPPVARPPSPCWRPAAEPRSSASDRSVTAIPAPPRACLLIHAVCNVLEVPA